MRDRMKQVEIDEGTEFVREAMAGRGGLIREYVSFLRYNKKWWLAPIIVVLLLFGVIVVLSGTVAAPFIYTLF